MKRDSFLVAELQQTAMRAFIGTSWLDEREASESAGDADTPSRVRLLKINLEIAKQTTVLAT
jgi:hypothetical protein